MIFPKIALALGEPAAVFPSGPFDRENAGLQSSSELP